MTAVVILHNELKLSYGQITSSQCCESLILLAGCDWLGMSGEMVATPPAWFAQNLPISFPLQQPLSRPFPFTLVGLDQHAPILREYEGCPRSSTTSMVVESNWRPGNLIPIQSHCAIYCGILEWKTKSNCLGSLGSQDHGWWLMEKASDDCCQRLIIHSFQIAAFLHTVAHW